MKLASILISLFIMSSSFAETYSYVVDITDAEDGGASPTVTLTLKHWMGTVLSTPELS